MKFNVKVTRFKKLWRETNKQRINQSDQCIIYTKVSKRQRHTLHSISTRKPRLYIFKMIYKSNWNLFRRLCISFNKNVFAHNKPLGSPKFYSTNPTNDKPPGNNKFTLPNADLPGIVKRPDTELYKRPVRGDPGKVSIQIITNCRQHKFCMFR